MVLSKVRVRLELGQGVGQVGFGKIRLWVR